jgi:transcriptional regulator with XRE-family HTH domain
MNRPSEKVKTGFVLWKAAKDAGLSLAEVARRAGVTRQTVSRLAWGRVVYPRAATLRAVALALGKGPGYLMRREP